MKNLKKVTLLPQLSVEIAIQPQALSVHALTRQLYLLYWERNKHPTKQPKTQQICHYRHARKTSGPFLLSDTGVDFSFRNNFANVGFFAKVSVPVESIISCLLQGIKNIQERKRGKIFLVCS